MYDDHLRLIRKGVVDFLLVLIELYSLGVTAEALRANVDWKSAFSLQQTPTNHSCCQKTRMKDLSCGIRMWVQVSFIVSQSTRLRDKQTDRRTERQYRVLH